MQDAILGELVERAAKAAGTRAEVARQLGVKPQRLSEWEHGHRQCPPEQVAMIADIAGLPAEEWLVRATLLNSKGKPYHERLHKALGKWLPRTGVALVLCFLLAGHTAFLGGGNAHAATRAEPSTMYILSIAILLLIAIYNAKSCAITTANS